MKVIVLFVFLALAAADVEYYTTADDNLDVETVFADSTKLHHFVDCFLDRAPCSELAASYKKIIPESIETTCRKCNTAQKHLASQFFPKFKVLLPEEYKNFRNKYDPEDKYFDDFEKEVTKY